MIRILSIFLFLITASTSYAATEESAAFWETRSIGKQLGLTPAEYTSIIRRRFCFKDDDDKAQIQAELLAMVLARGAFRETHPRLADLCPEKSSHLRGEEAARKVIAQRPAKIQQAFQETVGDLVKVALRKLLEDVRKAVAAQKATETAQAAAPLSRQRSSLAGFIPAAHGGGGGGGIPAVGSLQSSWALEEGLPGPSFWYPTDNLGRPIVLPADPSPRNGDSATAHQQELLLQVTASRGKRPRARRSAPGTRKRLAEDAENF